MMYYSVVSGLTKSATLIEFEKQGQVDRLFKYFIYGGI